MPGKIFLAGAGQKNMWSRPELEDERKSGQPASGLRRSESCHGAIHCFVSVSGQGALIDWSCFLLIIIWVGSVYYDGIAVGILGA